MRPSVFESFQSAYYSNLATLKNEGRVVAAVADPTSIGSAFGTRSRPTRELLGHQFEVSNARARLLHSPGRKVDAAFLAANLIWTLAGGGDVGMIAFYNPRGAQFARYSAFYEAAFGARLFDPHQQIQHSERKIRADESTRRALSMIYSLDDSIADRLDTPCAVGLHFMVRAETIYCVCMMRSQSAAMVLPYDFFLFSMIQEILSLRLQVPCGPMLYFSSSFHYYNDEEEIVDKVLEETPLSPLAMPEMLIADDATIQKVIMLEQLLRLKSLRGEFSMRDVLESGLDEYWIEFMAPIISLIRKRIGHTTGAEIPPASYWAQI